MSNENLILIEGERSKKVFTRIQEMVKTFPTSSPKLVETGLQVLSLMCVGPKKELVEKNSDFLGVIEDILGRIEEVSCLDQKLDFLRVLKRHLDYPPPPSETLWNLF